MDFIVLFHGWDPSIRSGTPICALPTVFRATQKGTHFDNIVYDLAVPVLECPWIIVVFV